jgi:pyruvate dehydrogenase complex dehydrogenase (E1) component
LFHGQTGSIPELYRHYGIDANAIVTAAAALTPGRPIAISRRCRSTSRTLRLRRMG